MFEPERICHLRPNVQKFRSQPEKWHVCKCKRYMIILALLLDSIAFLQVLSITFIVSSYPQSPR